VTAASRVTPRCSSVASPRRSLFARTVLLCLVLLAASPYHAPFSTFKQGRQGHVHSHAAFSQAASAMKLAHERRFASGFASPDMSAAVFEPVPVTPANLARPISGLRTRLSVLRL